MDPETSYERLVELMNKHWEAGPLAEDEVDELISCIDALDSWLKMGGFSPKAWSAKKGQQ